jgi:hypothetical protein
MKMRFSIRDLLWLFLVVAILFGWWFDRQFVMGRIGRYHIQPGTQPGIADSIYDTTSGEMWVRVDSRWEQVLNIEGR